MPFRRRLGPLSTLSLLLAALACGPGPGSLDEVGDESPAATAEATRPETRPEGWESLEGEAQAVRLYYQFVDGAGRVRFVERLEEVPERWRENVGFVKMDVPPPLSPAAAAEARKTQLDRRGFVPAATTGAGSGSRPILYAAEWCGACRKAKRYLARRGVDFEVRDVDNPAAAKELRRKTGARAIPVLDVGGRIVTGFSPRAYDALIDRV